MKKTLVTAAALLALLPAAQAQISITDPAFTYAQNFDSLTTATTAQPWANNSTLPGWSLLIGNGNAAPTLLGGTGSGNAGSFYSFGAAGSSERALGSTASGGTYFGSPATGAVAGWIAVAFTNNSGTVLDGFNFRFDGEQWRNGGNTATQSLIFEFGFGDSFATTSFSPGSTFSLFTSPVVGSTAAAVDGNTAGLVANLNGGTFNRNWAPGQTLWLRWADLNDAGNDHGLAIDNFSFAVTPVPEPGTLAMWLAGVASLGFVARRRRG
jgi:hypothetical protein